MTLDWALQTLIPLALLSAGAVILPMLFYRRHGPDLRSLALNLVASAAILIAFGTAIFAVLYLWAGADLSRRPAAAAGHLLRLGLSAALIWLPVLLLTGISLGIRSEARLAKIRESQEASR